MGDLTFYINSGRSQIASMSSAVTNLNIVTFVNGTETYAMPTPASSTGMGQAIAVISIAVPWGTYKPVLDRYSWSDFQAYFRLFSGTVTGFPECYGLLGSGANQTAYIFPIPSQTFAAEFQCAHQVLPLMADADPEALPYPFTDAVPFYATWLALLNAQRYQEAKAIYEVYKQYTNVARAASNPLYTGTAYPGIAGDRSGGP